MRALVCYFSMLGVVILAWLSFEQLPDTELQEHQKRAIVNRLHTYVSVAQLMYNMPELYPPSVSFQPGLFEDRAAESICLHGRIALGYPEWQLIVNAPMAASHFREYMAITIPHEAAHLILCAQGDPYWQQHGDRWSTIVRSLGAEPKEFHTYD